jgi:hypothetical protein
VDEQAARCYNVPARREPMPVGVGLPRPRRPRRSDFAAAAVVLAAILVVSFVGMALFIQVSLKPTDGHFGAPEYLVFPFCGHSYTIVDSVEQTSTVAPGYVIEPTLGNVPVLSLLTCPTVAGSYPGYVYLHVGADKYVGYLLDGYP